MHESLTPNLFDLCLLCGRINYQTFPSWRSDVELCIELLLEKLRFQVENISLCLVKPYCCACISLRDPVDHLQLYAHNQSVASQQYTRRYTFWRSGQVRTGRAGWLDVSLTDMATVMLLRAFTSSLPTGEIEYRAEPGRIWNSIGYLPSEFLICIFCTYVWFTFTRPKSTVCGTSSIGPGSAARPARGVCCSARGREAADEEHSLSTLSTRGYDGGTESSCKKM